MSRINQVSDWLLRSPLVWGMLAWLVFEAILRFVGSAWLDSYFVETDIHRLTTAAFFVGMAALAVRGMSLLGQFGVLGRPLIDPIRAGGQPALDAPVLAGQLDEQPSWLKNTYLVQRLRAVLLYVSRAESADNVEKQLRDLEEADYERMNAGYAMVRVITGVVPLLGFLGTVIGITQAIGKLSINPDQLEASLEGVIFNLSSAFSTTALALALSIVLVFAKLIVERLEDTLLVKTGKRMEQEFIGRFEVIGSATDPNVAAINRMCDEVVRAVEVMAGRQADLWRDTIDETRQHWTEATTSAGKQLTAGLEQGLRKGLTDHATGLTTGVERQLDQLNTALAGQAQALSGAVEKQTAVVTTAVAEQLALASQTITAQSQATHADLAAQSAATGEAIAKQCEAVSSGLTAQLTTVGDVLTHQLATMQDAATKQAEAATAVSQSVAQMVGEAAKQHTAQLEGGARELLGNLRTGLERMAELLVEALQKHGESLTSAEQELASENRRHLSEVEAALGEAMVLAADRQEKLIGRSEQVLRGMHESVSESASVTIAHQEQLVKQGEVLLKVVESTDQVRELQDALNQNLNALSRGHNLEETLMSLSAAIQLLSARTGRTAADTDPNGQGRQAA
ncbi:MAG: MotA/TolQ/ExbB proton channel family protein [Planctomycetota bacterium]